MEHCKNILPGCAANFAQIHEKLAHNTNELNEIKADVKSLVRAVSTGNGKPSLVSRVDNIESKLDNKIKKDYQDKEDEKNKKYKVIVPLVICVIASITSIVCALISLLN